MPLEHLGLAPHHLETIRNVAPIFEADPTVEALLLTGSLAHGFARPDSDVDIAIVVTAEELARRSAGGQLTYFDLASAGYEGGYVDGKYIDRAFIRAVAERGSDPARFAFEGARVLFTRVDDLADLLAEAVRYPVEEQAARIERFAAQMFAWRWYNSEAIRQHNRYLEQLSVQKVVLFACRVVLAANACLFPFHKWMLRVVDGVADRPANLLDEIDLLMSQPTHERVVALTDAVLAHHRLDVERLALTWPAHFMRDTESTWMTGTPPIDEV